MGRRGLAALVAAAALTGGAAQASEDCRALTSDISYCGPVNERLSGYGQAVFPDLRFNYRDRDDAPPSSHFFAVMPYDREVASWDDVFDMLIDQLVRGGTPPAAAFDRIVRSGREDVDLSTMQVEFIGLHRDGETVLNSWVAQALPGRGALVLIFSLDERADAVPDTLRAAHERVLADIRFVE
ncbi:MAG: hypothetical protein AAGE18_01290 [Pseudomonadota bacterium]